jgi:hypothetical protein
MGQIKTDADQAFRDYITDGVPGSGAHEPVKSDIRALMALVDALVGEAGLRWTFDSATDTAADPGAGDLRLNNATLASVTEIGISDKQSLTGNPDVSADLATWAASTSTIKGHLIVRKVAAAQNFAIYAVTAAADATTHWRFTVSHVASAGSFAAGEPLAGLFVRKGDKGDTGAGGSSGASALTIVRAVATVNVPLATGLENGDSIDGVTLATNDVVLLTGQTAAEENGVYVAVASGAASRHASFAAYDDLPGCYFSVMEGTAKADTLWRCTSDKGGTIDVTALAFSEFTGGASGGATLVQTHDLSTGSPTSIETTGLDGYSTIHLVMVNASKSASEFDNIQCGDGGGYDTTNLYNRTFVNAAADTTALGDGLLGCGNAYTASGYWVATLHNFNIAAPVVHHGSEQIGSAPFMLGGQSVNAKVYDRLKVISSAGASWSAGTLYVIGQN